ncbi:unnamed protein product, partial [Protopolystoma xenopodis]
MDASLSSTSYKGEASLIDLEFLTPETIVRGTVPTDPGLEFKRTKDVILRRLLSSQAEILSLSYQEYEPEPIQELEDCENATCSNENSAHQASQNTSTRISPHSFTSSLSPSPPTTSYNTNLSPDNLHQPTTVKQSELWSDKTAIVGSFNQETEKDLRLENEKLNLFDLTSSPKSPEIDFISSFWKRTRPLHSKNSLAHSSQDLPASFTNKKKDIKSSCPISISGLK